MMITRKKRRYFFKSASTRKAEYVFHMEMKTEQPEQSRQNAFSGVFLSTQLSIMPNNLVPKGDSWALREVAPFVLPDTHCGAAEGTPPKPTLPFSSAPSSPSFLVSPSLLHVLWVRQRTSNREQINQASCTYHQRHTQRSPRKYFKRFQATQIQNSCQIH